MASDSAKETPPAQSVLKGNTVKKPKKSWPPGFYIAIGVMVILSGCLLAMGFGTGVSSILYLIGLAFFLYGILVWTITIFYDIWQGGQKQ